MLGKRTVANSLNGAVPMIINVTAQISTLITIVQKSARHSRMATMTGRRTAVAYLQIAPILVESAVATGRFASIEITLNPISAPMSGEIFPERRMRYAIGENATMRITTPVQRE